MSNEPTKPASVHSRRVSSEVATTVMQAIGIFFGSAAIGLIVNYSSLASGELLMALEAGPGAEDSYEVIGIGDAVDRFHAGEAIFIDVRPRGQFEAGHIPGALNLPRRGFDEIIDEVSPWLPRDTVLIVYGSSGDLAAVRDVGNWLGDLGSQTRYVLAAGYEGWIEGKHPIETEKESVWNTP